MVELDPLDSLALTLRHAPGVQALLLGSGISRSAGIPTGWEITVDLIRRLARAQGIEDQADWPAWCEKTFGRAPSYSEILDLVASTPAERRTVIQGYIEPVGDEDKRRPTAAHEAIAKLVAAGAVRVVITTNFDRLLEAALREAGVEPSVIASDDAIVGATPLVHSRCTIIKLHGDYMDARIRNTEDELEAYSPSMNALLDRVLDEYGLVVCGWSGDWDTALKAAILRTPGRRYPFYWMSRGDPTTLGADLITHRGGRVIRAADADNFFSRLLSKVQALRADSPHPQSTAMIVAQGKSQCRDDRDAPDWSDLIAGEIQKISGFLNGADYPTGQPDSNSVNALVETIVIRTEALRRLVAIGTRWGGAEAFRVVQRAIASLASPSGNQSGYTYWISLRLLPAALCFQWAVAASILRDDLGRMHSLMHIRVQGRREDSKTAIASLPIAALDDIDWKMLKGSERAYTPHSNYFLPLFAKDARDIVVGPDEAERAWDDAEFWIAMEFAAVRLPDYVANRSWFWMPPGRFTWKRDGVTPGERIAALRALPADAPAFKAGLLGGEPARAKEIIDAAEEFLNRVAGSRY